MNNDGTATCGVHGVTFQDEHDGRNTHQIQAYEHPCEETGMSNDKDLEIAKLKLEAFELRQKVRDFASLHERYIGL